MSRAAAILIVAALAIGSLGPATAHVAMPSPDLPLPEPPRPPGEGPQLDPCDQEPGEPVAELTAETFDEAYAVEVEYNASRDRAADAAEHVLDGALASYKAHVGNWGYHSDDPDGVLEYEIVPSGVCTVPDDDLKIKITEDIQSFADGRGLNYTSVDALYAVTTHHETNHHFLLSAVDYYSEQEWENWDWLYNGFAATSETWFAKPLSTVEDSPFYENNGADDYVDDTGESIFRRGSHTNDLYLGYLYAHDGGLDLFDVIWGLRSEESADVDPKRVGPRILDEALASVEGDHDSFEASLADFAYSLVRREDLAWSTPGEDDLHDWETELEEVDRVAELSPGDSFHGSVGAWAIEFVDVDASDDGEIFLTRPISDDHLRAWVYTRTGEDWSRNPLEDQYPVSADRHDEVVVGVLRTASANGTYGLGFRRYVAPSGPGPALWLVPSVGEAAWT